MTNHYKAAKKKQLWDVLCILGKLDQKKVNFFKEKMVTIVTAMSMVTHDVS